MRSFPPSWQATFAAMPEFDAFRGLRYTETPDLSAVLRALHVTGLLAGRATPTPAQGATLGTSVLDLVEGLLSDGG